SEHGLKSGSADSDSRDGGQEREVGFPPANGSGEVRGVLHRPPGPTRAGLLVTHGRSNDMRNLFVKRIATAASQAGLAALRMNFRYADEKGRASRDLTREEDDLRGAVRFLRKEIGDRPIFVAGKSMGARVCARASSDSDVAGMIALGYPLHPQFRPQVRNPPEWPLIVKPALFVKGASPMQAYCVSKRPPRALYLGLAIALGMVAISTVVLSQMGGGLLRDGTYLRLLGYSPSNRAASLTALGATDASASRGVLSASSAPGPTPAPARADVARSPSDAPANATP